MGVKTSKPCFLPTSCELLDAPAEIHFAINCQGAIHDGEVGVGDDFVCCDFGDFAKSMAGWAGATGRVEAKHAGLKAFKHDFGVVGACAEGAVHGFVFETFEFLLLGWYLGLLRR